MKIGDLVTFDGEHGFVVELCANPYYIKVWLFAKNKLILKDIEFFKKIS